MAGYATPEGIVYLETKTFKNFGAGRHTVLTWGAKPFLLLSCPVLLGAFFWQKLLAIGLILAYVRDRKRLRSSAAACEDYQLERLACGPLRSAGVRGRLTPSSLESGFLQKR